MANAAEVFDFGKLEFSSTKTSVFLSINCCDNDLNDLYAIHCIFIGSEEEMYLLFLFICHFLSKSRKRVRLVLRDQAKN